METELKEIKQESSQAEVLSAEVKALNEKISQLASNFSQQRTEFSKVQNQLSQEQKLEQVLKEQNLKDQKEIEEEHTRILTQDKRIAELSSMLAVEAKNTQSLTKQLGDGISLLKETKTKMGEVKANDRK